MKFNVFVDDLLTDLTRENLSEESYQEMLMKNIDSTFIVFQLI